MRVALVCDWFLPRSGGIELHLRDLALALRSNGVDAEVVTTTPGAEVVDHVRVHRVSSIAMPGTGVAVSPGAIGSVREVLVRERFDVVHAHASVISPIAYGAAFAAADLGIPAALTFHSMLHGSALLLGAADALLGLSRRVSLSAVSSVVAAQAVRWMHRADVAILPNGIDAGFWQGTEVRTQNRSVVIVTAMRLVSKKRGEALLRSFAEATGFVAGSPPLHLVIAGAGPRLGALRRLALELGVSTSVEFAGALSRERLRELYSGADMFVLPSERESFGIAALEARAAGLPVIARLGAGPRDFIVTGRTGVLVKDEAEMAHAIAGLCVDQARRKAMAARCRAEPVPYDWSDVARAHVEFYAVTARRALASR